MVCKRTIEEVEEILQKRINQILQNNEKENYDKLPGLVESLKLIKEHS
jgi:hypothetical protein